VNDKGFNTTEPDAPEVETKESKLRDQFARLTNTAANLQRLTFPKLHYVVPGIIPEGLTLIAGKPKVGKSFLCLDVAIAILDRTCTG
jgi:predicted ATP-dependent serine protease